MLLDLLSLFESNEEIGGLAPKAIAPSLPVVAGLLNKHYAISAEATGRKEYLAAPALGFGVHATLTGYADFTESRRRDELLLLGLT